MSSPKEESTPLPPVPQSNQQEYNATHTFHSPLSKCDAVDIPPEEIANGIKQLLTDVISLPAADLSKACAQLFGFARSGSNIDTAMQRGIEEAIKKNYVIVENEKVTICKSIG